jgi:signal transduction histidine kinase
MRLSTKLAIGLTLTSVVILGSYGAWQLQREEADLRHTADHDFRLLGTAVQIAVENSMRDGQAADVREILEALELRDSAVAVLVFDHNARLQANSWGSAGATALVRDALPRVRAEHRADVWFDGPRGLTNLIGLYPLRDDHGADLGIVAVIWPLDELRRDLRATAMATALSSATLIAGIAGMGWLLSLILVRRPLRTLTDAMKAVEAGDWVTTVPRHGDDEVGAALTQFNTMVGELTTARAKLIEAAEAREALESGLQRLDKLVTVGQLSAGLAHEIGSPLQVLSGRARAIAARSDLPEEVRRSAAILERQSDRIATIVEQLLSFARRSATQMAEIDVAAAVRAIVELMGPEARRRKVRLEMEVAPALPGVTGDSDRIQQVAMNLISNALRATPANGTVRVGLTTATLDGGREVGGRTSVQLRVADSGEGIRDEARLKIFEPFFTTWASNGGTGLGLAVVKSIVDEHGGLIDVASDPGRGTCFTVSLPTSGERPLVAVA